MTNPKIRAEHSDKEPKSRSQRQKSDYSENERVRGALRALDKDVPWLASETGIPASTLYDSLKRGIGKPDQAVRIAKALNVTLDWLLTGAAGDTSLAKRGAHATGRGKSDVSIAQLGLRMIPEVDIAYSMGGGSLIEHSPETTMVPFRSDWLDRLARGFKADVFLTRGQGDSMMPTILDDDDVLVNRADNVVRHQDRIWALGYGELGMIKRVRRLPNGMFQLNSDNPSVSPVEATEDELFVVGRVIWIGRRV